MKLLLIILLVMQFLTASSCNGSGSRKDEVKKTSSNGDNINNFFPLRVGNSWKYINEGPRDETEVFEVKALSTEKTDGGIQIKMSAFPYLTKDNTERTIKANEKSEILISDYMGYSGIIVPSQADFKDGYSWKFGELTGRISSYSDTVNTESGNFTNCRYVMLTDGFTFSYEMWFKKDIGIVKWGANRTNPPVLKPIYYVLKDYSLK